jgi:serine/threonine-protein phosphatase PP1-1
LHGCLCLLNPTLYNMAPKESDVPQPGPARLSKGAGPDEWLEQAKTCKYLPEADMKRLCEIVKECLMEGEFLSLP